MHRRLVLVAAFATAFTMAVAGVASATPLLQAQLAPAGLGYNSDGTFEGIDDFVDSVCAEAGQQDLAAADGLSASLCDERPYDPETEPHQGWEALTADTSGLPTAPGVPSVSGYSSDGTLDALQGACELGALLGIPVEGQTVEVTPGVSVSVCDDQ